MLCLSHSLKLSIPRPTKYISSGQWHVMAWHGPHAMIIHHIHALSNQQNKIPSRFSCCYLYFLKCLLPLHTTLNPNIIERWLCMLMGQQEIRARFLLPVNIANSNRFKVIIFFFIFLSFIHSLVVCFCRFFFFFGFRARSVCFRFFFFFWFLFKYFNSRSLRAIIHKRYTHTSTRHSFTKISEIRLPAQ